MALSYEFKQALKFSEAAFPAVSGISSQAPSEREKC